MKTAMQNAIGTIQIITARIVAAIVTRMAIANNIALMPGGIVAANDAM